MSKDLIARLREYPMQDTEEAADEIERLNQAVKYEQFRSDRVGTHAVGCHTWGPSHYECLKRELKEQEKVSIAKQGIINGLKAELARTNEELTAVKQIADDRFAQIDAGESFWHGRYCVMQAERDAATESVTFHREVGKSLGWQLNRLKAEISKDYPEGIKPCDLTEQSNP